MTPWAVIQHALVNAEQTCRFHGKDFGAMGYETPWAGVEPRCDSCKQPWRVEKALDALDELIRATLPTPSDTTQETKP